MLREDCAQHGSAVLRVVAGPTRTSAALGHSGPLAIRKVSSKQNHTGSFLSEALNATPLTATRLRASQSHDAGLLLCDVWVQGLLSRLLGSLTQLGCTGCWDHIRATAHTCEVPASPKEMAFFVCMWGAALNIACHGHKWTRDVTAVQSRAVCLCEAWTIAMEYKPW